MLDGHISEDGYFVAIQKLGVKLKAHTYTPAMAELELVLLSAEAESFSDADFYTWLREIGRSCDPLKIPC